MKRIFPPRCLYIRQLQWSLIAVLLSVQLVDAQEENTWIFGINAGLDFNNLIPTAITSNIGNRPPVFGEGNASTCNTKGRLLFYTEGSYVFNRQHALMPNGGNLTPLTSVNVFSPTSSTSQGTIIVPVPEQPSLYYIFSLTSYEQHTANNWGRLYYSIVDMRLNDGMGDVISGSKGILLDSLLSESMTAVAGDHCNVWLLTVTRTSTIKAYEITVTGINATPVLSPITSLPFISSGGSCIMVSPDRKKLTVTQNQPGGLALFDFDLMSGKATSERMLDPRSGYNACFSPDNSKLYISQAQGLFQFDLTGRTLNQIINSRTHIAIANLTHLKAGPDGKIYFQGNPGFLSVLQAPNQPGLTCQPKINEIPLAPGTSMHLGLPNSVPVTPSDTLPDTLFTSRSYNLKCNEELLLAPKQTSGRNFIWHDGVTSSSRLFTQPGTYWVSYRASPPCRYHIDTIIVKAAPTYHHKFTEVICATESYNFNGRLIHQAGTYSDTLFSGTTCDSIITLNLVVLPVPHLVISIEPEGLLCIGDTVVGIASGAKKYQWYNQDQVITDENTAYLPLTNSINQFHVLGIADNTCKDTAAVVVNATECCELFIPNAFSPNNDGTNDRFTVIPNGHLRRFSMQLFNRWGQLIFATNDKHASWDGTYLGAAADAGTYFYIITADCLIDKELMRKGDVLLIR